MGSVTVFAAYGKFFDILKGFGQIAGIYLQLPHTGGIYDNAAARQKKKLPVCCGMSALVIIPADAFRGKNRSAHQAVYHHRLALAGRADESNCFFWLNSGLDLVKPIGVTVIAPYITLSFDIFDQRVREKFAFEAVQNMTLP